MDTDSPDVRTVPFTEDECVSFNASQKSPMFHPYTCGNQKHSEHMDLIATPEGLRCPDKSCDYLQTWAHAFSMNWKWHEAEQALDMFKNNLLDKPDNKILTLSDKPDNKLL